MVLLTPAPAPWSSASVVLYQTTDAGLGNLPVLIFYGPSTTTNATLNSSRIQAHIFSLAGYNSFPRLTISPTSPLYEPVRYLSEDRQGDETFRGLAVSLFKYFSEMPPLLREQLSKRAAPGVDGPLFDAAHAARIVSKLARSDNTATMASKVTAALAARYLSCVDIDVLVSSETAMKVKSQAAFSDEEVCSPFPISRSADVIDLVSMLGSPAFLPTSKLRRAPSRPTGMSRVKSLSAAEVEALQREMMEATETEVAYVNKLRDLDRLMAVEDAQITPTDESQDTNSWLRSLLRTLREIVVLNGDFLKSIVELMDETTSHTNYGQPEAATPGRHDITGAEAFAKILLAFLPKFNNPYQQYLRLSPHIPRMLSTSPESGNSALTAVLSQIGEMRLKSWLIEPVQRLPRYSLFVDNMIALLPSSHPAINKFLRAKDLIADICALDSDDTDADAEMIRRLRDLVVGWPSTLPSAGRMITASDALEIKPPYDVSIDEDSNPCVLMLFAGLVVILRRLEFSTLSSRGLLAELQRPSHTPPMVDGEANGPQQQFAFVASFPVAEIIVTQSGQGHHIFLTHLGSRGGERDNTSSSPVTTAYCLKGSYEGKAAKFTEDFARARIENRFPEAVRDGSAWSFRVLPADGDQIGMAIAMFNPAVVRDKSVHIKGRGRIIVDIQEKGSCDEDGSKTPFSSAEADFRVKLVASDVFRLDGKWIGGRRFSDEVPTGEVIPLLLKRVVEKLRHEASPVTMDAVETSIAFNQKILESIRPRHRLNSASSRIRLRPLSPVKALSSIFGSSTKLSQYLSSSHEQNEPLASPSTTARQLDFLGKDSGQDNPKAKFTVVSAADAPANGSMLQLETTFNTYTVALHCRAGNIVGRSIRNRENADELAVNELYNTLIEDPSQHQAAAEVPVNILFAAFAKFVAYEWKERMGEILPPRILEALQSTFDQTPPSELAWRVKGLLHELSPQNHRVLAATIKLLYDLLEASCNDADRGALTASFTEVLVRDRDPHDYIPLLDRLVDDVDTFFDDAGQIEVSVPGHAAPAGSIRRMRSINTGSLSSTGSSLKKRLGFGMLGRENSKTEPEFRINHMWRTLSKKSSSEADGSGPGSVRSFLGRAKSSERDHSRMCVSRPGSADRPCSAYSVGESPHSAFSSIRSRVDTLNELAGSPSATAHSRRPKRRSSLSDLQELDQATPFEASSPLHQRTPQQKQVPNWRPTPLTPTHGYGPDPFDLPAGFGKKENVNPSAAQSRYDGAKHVTAHSVARPGHHERGESASRVARMPLAESATAENRPSPPPRTTSSLNARKVLKSQSPQKIRDRIEKERSTAELTGSQLQAKLLALQSELQPNLHPPASAERRLIDDRLRTLEQKVADSQQETQRRLAGLAKEVESSLLVSEQRCRKLDKVYQAAHMENELLYERFNAELAKVFQNLQAEGVEALLAKLQEAQADVARLQQENFKLRRENIQLQSHLGGPGA